MEKHVWDSKYAGEQYFYGTAPNVFFAQNLKALPFAGKLLLPAEGEGRNAVWAASQGWDVMAYDFSQRGQDKALALAQKHGQSIDYQLMELQNAVLPAKTFDSVAIIFMHIPTGQRHEVFSRIIRALKPGASLIMEVFSKNQPGHPSGGPKDQDLLYSIREIQKLLHTFDIQNAEEKVVMLHEGYHEGSGSVIQVLAKKKQD